MGTQYFFMLEQDNPRGKLFGNVRAIPERLPHRESKTLNQRTKDKHY